MSYFFKTSGTFDVLGGEERKNLDHEVSFNIFEICFIKWRWTLCN